MIAAPDSSLAAVARRDPELRAWVLARALVPEPANLVARPWGGDAIRAHKRLGGRDPQPIGESFEAAADPWDREAREHPSMIALPGGTVSLAAIVHAFPEIVGAAHLEAFGPRLPLLPKLLDIHELLSIQAHPRGHPEAYLILAADPGATVHVGWRRDVDRDALAAEIAEGLAHGRRIAAACDDARAQTLSRALVRGDAIDPALAHGLDDAIAAVRRTSDRLLSALHTIPAAVGTVIHNGVRGPSGVDASVHALGNRAGARVLALELRCAGPTLRLWDHGRLPLRPLDAEAALAALDLHAVDPGALVVTPGAAAVTRCVDNGVFELDLVRADASGLELPGDGRMAVVHACEGEISITSPAGLTIAIDRGRTALVPATWSHWRLAGTAAIARTTIPRTALAARSAGLRRLHRIVADDRGPTHVVAITNGDDGPIVRDRLAALAPEIFRADGTTHIAVVEERTRRGQLLGLLDADRSHPVRDGVVLGIMLPGQGTRLSPLTQRWHGIKPFVPMPVRPRPGGRWLDAGAASVWSWIAVADRLARGGFAGVAWKWGDEPQIPSADLERCAVDFAGCDAVRFGTAAPITDDLARNKEWLVCDAEGRLVVQLRRRAPEALRARLQQAGAGARALVHIGSPALSFAMLDALAAEFGDLPGWLDVDGYLFESLTHDDAAWQAECERDAGLRTLLADRPDFRARTLRVRDRIEAVTARPLRIGVVDFGADTWWGDMGQLARAHAAFAALARGDADGEFARRLADVDTIVPDDRGNRITGATHVDPSANVRDSVLVDAWIGPGVDLERTVIIDGQIGAGRAGPGSVVVASTIAALWAEADACIFAAIADAALDVPARGVVTTIAATTGGLEHWRFDLDGDPGAPASYRQPCHDNPGSFADKFAEVRRRDRPPAVIEAELAARRTALARRIAGDVG